MKLLKLNMLFFCIFVLFTTLILLMTQSIFEMILSLGAICCSLALIYFIYTLLLNEDLQTKTFALLFSWIIVLLATLVLAPHKIWLIISSIPFVCIFAFDLIRKINKFIVSDKIYFRIFQLSLVAIYCGTVLYFSKSVGQMIGLLFLGVLVALFCYITASLFWELFSSSTPNNHRRKKRGVIATLKDPNTSFWTKILIWSGLSL
ncbi:hypothetical protein CUPS9163_05930 [Campylobacter upsaliensis]|uniref:hypothetical protein n=1 Tax=Campylobacter upsaliensis TaxID=28080 RepID=UPI002149ABFF|nr:hypothetical protein [Campylobacter upsaliensis]MCR2091849.1 hypothetical protein [Campylobacter upsaliensis]